MNHIAMMNPSTLNASIVTNTSPSSSSIPVRLSSFVTMLSPALDHHRGPVTTTTKIGKDIVKKENSDILPKNNKKMITKLLTKTTKKDDKKSQMTMVREQMTNQIILVIHYLVNHLRLHLVVVYHDVLQMKVLQ